jgi:23S rRNA (cytidine1920-2'-O)/16S rRNA (cytidine1409-2'-O)-methyltransferase
VDVGYGILAHKLRVDERVVVLERTNVRMLDVSLVPDRIDMVVGDLSFIGWAAVLPAVTPLLASNAALVLLVKPQFELAAAGRDGAVPGGVVTDLSAIQSCLDELYNVWVSNGLSVAAVVLSPLRGAKGNRELFVHLKCAASGLDTAEYSSAVAAQLAGADQ